MVESNTLSLDSAHPRTMFLIVPVRIDGGSVEVDLECPLDPFNGYNCHVEDGTEAGRWETDYGTDFVQAWEHLAGTIWAYRCQMVEEGWAQ